MVKQSIHCDWSEITDKARTVITQHHAGVWLVAPNIISPTFFLDFTAVQPIIGFTMKDSRLFLLFFASGRSIAAFHSGEAKPDYEVFSIPLLASDQWKLRQQLEGFLQFGGSLECWEVTVTFDVTAPPSGRTRERSLCGLLLLSIHMRLNSSYSASLSVRQHKLRANLFTTVTGLKLHCTMNRFGYVSTLTSQQVWQQGSTLLGNSVVSFSNVLK